MYSGWRPLRDDIPDRTAIATCVAVGRKLGRDGVCCSLRRVRAELPRAPSPPSTSACAVDTADAEHEYAAQPKSTPISTCSPPPPTAAVSLCSACIPQRPDGPSTTENKTIRANQDQRPPRSTDHPPTRGEPRPHRNTHNGQSSYGAERGPSLGAKHPAHAARTPWFSNTEDVVRSCDPDGVSGRFGVVEGEVGAVEDLVWVDVARSCLGDPDRERELHTVWPCRGPSQVGDLER